MCAHWLACSYSCLHVLLTPESSFSDHAISLGRSLLSLLSQCFLWVGGWNILLSYSEESIYRDLFYLFIGVSLFSGIRGNFRDKEGAFVFVHGNGTVTKVDKDGNENTLSEKILEQKTSVTLFLTAVVSIIAQFLILTGSWQLFDVHIGEWNLMRHTLYFFGGFFLIYVTDSLETDGFVLPLMISSSLNTFKHDFSIQV